MRQHQEEQEGKQSPAVSEDEELVADEDEDGEAVLDTEDLEFVEDDGDNGTAAVDDDEEDDGEAELSGERRQPLEVTRDDAVATLTGHASSIFCLAAAPADSGGGSCLLASGGEDDRALVWRVAGAVGDNGEVQATLAAVCARHGDSVVFVAFNRTGSLLATGDLAGRIHVWETGLFTAQSSAAAPTDAAAAAGSDPQSHTTSAEATPVWSGEVAELRWGCWHPQVASALLIGAGDGSCWLWQVPSGECKVLPSGQGPGETTCGLVLPGDPRSALVAYDNGQVRLFDLKAAAAAAGQAPLTCDSAVLAMDAAPTSGLAACGTESGQVVCFRAASPRLPLSVCNLAQVSASAATSVSGGSTPATAAFAAAPAPAPDNWAVECVQFCPQQETLLAAGCLAGFAFVFSLAAGGDLRVRLRCDVGDGVVRVLWLPASAAVASPRFVTADVGGRARLWDGLSGEPLREWRGHRDALLDACLLHPTGQLLLATCADKCDCTVKLFPID